MQFSVSHLFVLRLNVRYFYLTRGILSGATTPSQGWPGSDGNEWVLFIPQIFQAEASPSDC